MNLETVIRKGRDAQELLACVREHGICVVPAFYPPDVIDPIRDACAARIEGAADANYEDGSYKRVDSYKGTAAASNERIYHADCFSPQAARFRGDDVLKQVDYIVEECLAS